MRSAWALGFAACAAVLGCTMPVEDVNAPSKDEEVSEIQPDFRWDPTHFEPNSSSLSAPAGAWTFPSADAFRERFEAWPEARFPRLVDIEGFSDRERGHREHRLLLLRGQPAGTITLASVDGSQGICRGQCYPRDSHYELVRGELSAGSSVEILEDEQSLIHGWIAGSMGPSRPTAPIWEDWVYARTLLDESAAPELEDPVNLPPPGVSLRWRGITSKDGDDAALVEIEPAEYLDAGDVIGYLKTRVQVLRAWQNTPARDCWVNESAPVPSLPPPVRPERLRAGPVDLTRLFVGLLVSMDGSSPDAGGRSPKCRSPSRISLCSLRTRACPVP